MKRSRAVQTEGRAQQRRDAARGSECVRDTAAMDGCSVEVDLVHNIVNRVKYDRSCLSVAIPDVRARSGSKAATIGQFEEWEI
ncbi:predicted protein [Chaetomium globosum CBS 148.51]|uniref:Uncharacterized protein n=1 Tax=Chaetomium globosum (strain ATCC 6205 / CBS 148.51 / DSM 1962 / NBRC 6347 / NRRL 1970) TaxID=306901 RepID=Q2HGJ4_CHAGB|nr:uncharacterized protein CHGG_00660 [Chaetomium globosum CBS 148.51]EAQ92425.1 predicted protein [Chaetomium globosum CBS 148.51]